MKLAATVLAFATGIFWALSSSAAPVKTIDGVVIITMADVAAGGITSGDAPGFPISINSSGTYRLGERLSVSGATNAISANVAMVTIDLNGFFIAGNGVGLSGIIGNQRSLTVKNGTVRNFTQDGMKIVGPEAMIVDMRVSDNVGVGIRNLGTGQSATTGKMQVLNNIIYNNGTGILCNQICYIKGNIVSNNAQNGLEVYNGSIIIENTISDNGGVGINSTSSGFGTNVIFGNLAPVGGPPTAIGQNFCSPQAC